MVLFGLRCWLNYQRRNTRDQTRSFSSPLSSTREKKKNVRVDECCVDCTTPVRNTSATQLSEASAAALIMIGLIISRQRTPIALASRASFLINSNEELGTACFSSRRCVLPLRARLTPADGRARRFSGARPSYRLLFPQESFSQSHAHSLALCCSCFPGGPACSSTRQARAPVSLGFSFISSLFFFRTSALSGRGTPLVGRKVFREAAGP